MTSRNDRRHTCSKSKTMHRKQTPRFLILSSIVIASVGVATLFAAPAEPNDTHVVSPLMQMKLEKSKAILEGLTLEDYGAVAKNSRALRLLSMEAGWKVIQTEKYAAQSSDFRRATDIITEAAEDKDISRATLGYVALTVRCVECHSYMRKHRIQLMKLENQ